MGSGPCLRWHSVDFPGMPWVSPELLSALLIARQHGAEKVLATRLTDGAQILLPDPSASLACQHAGIEAIRHDRTGIVEIEGHRWFFHVHASPHRLIIVGAVHIAQSLARMALMTGLAVTVIDPRRGFASEERFPGIALLHQWPDEALSGLKVNRRTAIVVLTHDPKIDDPALDFALRMDGFFIGALGSRTSHARRLERLAALGHSQDALRRIRGPVGLPIGALTAAEIALSTLAEIVAIRRGARAPFV